LLESLQSLAEIFETMLTKYTYN